MNAPRSTPEERANELYWRSEDTVEEVAERLEMSRGALYSHVRPLEAGGECPDCGAALVYPNRSSRAAGRAACPECERTFAEEAAAAPVARGEESHPHLGQAPGNGDASGRLRRWREDLAAVEPERAAMIGGAAALGVVFGAAAATLARRRG